jgi:hypothetical protein
MRRPRFTIRSMMIAVAVAALASWLGIRLWGLTGIMRLIVLANLGIFAISAVGLTLLNRRQEEVLSPEACASVSSISHSSVLASSRRAGVL